MATRMLAPMRNRPIKQIRRLILGPLCCCSILAGCASSSVSGPNDVRTSADNPSPAPTRPDPVRDADPAREADRLREAETLRTVVVASLTPDQGIDARHIGKRVRWAGVVHHMSPTNTGVCLTLLYSLSNEGGEPRWNANGTDQSFQACTTGTYDPELVQNFTNVTIIGRISGKTDIGMGGGSSVGPVVEIEKLYRWSDCLAGETNPVCKIGFLTPKPVVEH